MATANPTIQPQVAAQAKSRRKMMERVWLIFLQLLITFILIVFSIPVFWIVSSSLKVSTEVFAGDDFVWIPADPQWQNYLEIFDILPFATFTVNSLIVVFFAVLGTIVSSALVGYSFARMEWPGRDFFFGILLVTLMLPDVITLVPRFIIFRQLGWIDTLLPLTVPFWFATTPFTPLYVFLMRQFFKGIPVELEEAALIDGASRLRIFAQIILPLSKPVLATTAVLAMVQHYTDFMNPLIYLNSVENWTLAVGLAGLNADESFRSSWELIFAAGTYMTIPLIIVFIFAQRYFVQGIAMSGFGGR